ncbi:MAG: type 4a pilus biogenesis protein PilO [Candidatus Omnitrophota bacterium]|nr:type 4a pilus biogenesis protein PilO [Candidatus Omnitrophota bacterium]
MADLNEKQKLYVLFAIFGFIGVMLYYNFLLKPQFAGFNAKNKEYRVVRDRVKNEEIMMANEASLNRQHESFQKQADYLQKRLPGQDQISSLLEDFSSVAESSGVKILRIKPLEEPVPLNKAKQVNNAYTEFPILIEARAGYHQLGVFVNKLEAMDRFIKITDIDIVGMEKDPRRHDIKLRVMTYVLQ